MGRNLWAGLALIISVLASILLFPQLPDIADSMTSAILDQQYVVMFRNSLWFALAAKVSVAALFAFLLAFLGPAIGDAIAVFALQRRLSSAATRSADKKNTKPLAITGFLELFGKSEPLATTARAYSGTLVSPTVPGSAKSSRAQPVFSTATAGRYFTVAGLVDKPLQWWLFRPLPAALAGLGFLCFLGALIAANGEARAAGPATIDWSHILTQDGIPGLFMATTTALLMAFLGTATRRFRHAQTAALALSIDCLFPPLATATSLADIARQQKAAGDALAANVSKLGDRIHQDLAKQWTETSRNSENAARLVAESLSASVEEALAKPLSKVTSATRHLTRDQSARVQKLLDGVLARFNEHLEKKFGAQLKNAEQLIKNTEQSLLRTEGSFGTAIDHFTETVQKQTADLASTIAERLSQIKETDGQRYSDLQAALDSYGKALQADVETHASRFEVAIEDVVTRASATAEDALARSAGNLSKTADSFDALYGAIENLVTLITPVLNQVIENQESLLGAIESETTASKAIGRASSEMSSAAQASRETVERFIALAERMRELSVSLQENGGNNQSAPETSAGKRLTRPKGQLSSAVRELRDVAKNLPNMRE